MLVFTLATQRDGKAARHPGRQLGRGRRIRAREKPRAQDLDGRQRYVVGRAKAARHAAHRMRFQLGAARDAYRRGQLRARAAQVKLRHAA
ncbi:hypothetical protein D3C87_1436850 [compost metagenome]